MSEKIFNKSKYIPLSVRIIGEHDIISDAPNGQLHLGRNGSFNIGNYEIAIDEDEPGIIKFTDTRTNRMLNVDVIMFETAIETCFKALLEDQAIFGEKF